MSLEVALLLAILQIFFIVIFCVKSIILCENAPLIETRSGGCNNHFNGISGTNKVMNGNRFITRPLLLICVENSSVIHT